MTRHDDPPIKGDPHKGMPEAIRDLPPDQRRAMAKAEGDKVSKSLTRRLFSSN